MEKNTLCDRIWLGLEQKWRKKYHFWKGFGENKGKKSKKNNPFCKALIRKQAKIEKNTRCARALVRIRANIEKHPSW